MKYTLEGNFTQIALARLVERGRALEARRDLEGAIENFAPIWPDIDRDPDFSAFEPGEQAVLYRLTGFFLSIYGNVRSLKSYQERAKNLLCRSSDLFDSLNDRHSSADARNVLALCYINEGAVLEGEVILEQAAEDLIGEYLHPVYLRNRVNLLIAKRRQGKYDEALQVIEENLIPIEFCQDLRVNCLFHEKAGIIYRILQQYDQAIRHYHESIRFALQLDNPLFLSSQHNNLAFLYNKIRNFELAHTYINEAINLAQENNFKGALPSYLDTQALIFANEGFPNLALTTIDKAISILVDGDDYFSLTEAIWNKCKFLLQLDRKEEAVLLFAELIPLAGQRMGDFAVKQFTREFSEIIHVKREGLSLDEDLQRFKRNELRDAIRKANFNLHQAAQNLKIKIADLSKILNNEFPELYGELDLQKPKRAEHEAKTGRAESTASIPRVISPLSLQNVDFSLTAETSGEILTFYVAAEKLPARLPLRADAIVAVVATSLLCAGDLAIVSDPVTQTYSLGYVQYDEAFDLSYIVDPLRDAPVFLNDLDVVGRVVGYCPFREINNNKLSFSPLADLPADTLNLEY
jgi:tetratricopeptide (TPR) repeat protein